MVHLEATMSIQSDAETESPKRQAIISAAGELFVAHGYGAVSMDAVARAAGVSKATLYAHFASKDLLFASIISQACRESVAVADILPDPSADIGDELSALGGRILRFLLQDRALAIHRVVIGESIRFPELGRAFYDNGPAVLRRVFGAWIARQNAAGRLDVPEPERAADLFCGMLRTGLYLRASLGIAPSPGEAEIDATVAGAVTMFLRAYGNGREAA
jgi:TetR/AcrR family transcriptional regulator, mexJK operon transcriptional repressor